MLRDKVRHAVEIIVRELIYCGEENGLCSTEVHMCVSMCVCVECLPSQGPWGAGVFSMDQAAFGLSANEQTWVEQTAEIEECGADVNWEEICNQIPLKYFSFNTKFQWALT